MAVSISNGRAINIDILYFRVFCGFVCFFAFPFFVHVAAACRCIVCVCVCESKTMALVREKVIDTRCVRGSKVIRKTNNSSLDLSVIDHCVSMWIGSICDTAAVRVVRMCHIQIASVRGGERAGGRAKNEIKS